ncbi:MAG: Rhamnulokinase [Oscillospiraceae bacterium]|jgi:rhamnulokinase
MTRAATVLAFDLGASNGRAIKARYEDGKLSCQEIHRFENNPSEYEGHFCWDFDALLAEVRTGIQKAGSFDSVAFDTWGVDFGLLGQDGKLVSRPVHYRDSRTDGMVERASKTVGTDELYQKTGNQLLPINTLFQLLALKEQQPEILQKAKTLLFMPDLFSYFLCGNAVCEQSIASTSQMLCPKTKKWRTDVLNAFGIPTDIFLPTIPSGTVTGSLPNGAKVIAVAGHDTQCAVAAVPFQSADAAFLSCGTWSLLGAEIDSPILTTESCRMGLSNEIGANGKINYLKNIIGLWLIQESRRAWRRKGQDYSYADLERLAREAQPLQCFINPDAPEFAQPGDIPERVCEFCRRSGQYVPQNVGEIMRCIYESLALKYRWTVEQLQHATGKHFSVLHIIGGGTKDRLLCQMSADSTGLPVTAGPVEASALGNIIIQLVALGFLPDISAGRALIARSATLEHYEPNPTQAWNQAYKTYKTFLSEE